jgi:hypothetical protein
MRAVNSCPSRHRRHKKFHVCPEALGFGSYPPLPPPELAEPPEPPTGVPAPAPTESPLVAWEAVSDRAIRTRVARQVLILALDAVLILSALWLGVLVIGAASPPWLARLVLWLRDFPLP